MTVEGTDEGVPFFNKSVGPAHPEDGCLTAECQLEGERLLAALMFAATFRGSSCLRVRSGLPGSRIAGSVTLGHATSQNAFSRKRTVARNRFSPWPPVDLRSRWHLAAIRVLIAA